ncbi:MAG: DUF2835 domain-containing protein [Candidatus Kuenenia sp.]|nr:DUF2835 domain-containing protein [Candidatus Kuenenia hertensis]
MQRFQFSLDISSDVYMAYYTGAAKYIHTTTTSGKTIKFPASALRKHLTHNGIHGFFEIEIGKNNKLLNIRKINTKPDSDGIWL